MKIISKSVEETIKIGKCLGEIAAPGDIFCLNGDLGAGKTHFAKGLAAGLGINEHITSPTYNIVNEYNGQKKFIHFDVYRINEPDEVLDIGFDEYINGSGVVLIEWSDLIDELLPKDRLEIKITKIINNNSKDYSEDHLEDHSEDYREIYFKPFGEYFVKLVEEMNSLCTF